MLTKLKMEWVRKTSVLLALAIASTPAPAFAQRKGSRSSSPSSTAGKPAPTGSAGSNSGANATTTSTPPAGSTATASGSIGGPDAETAAKAQQHFKHARELYQQGSYTEAISELEAAHKLDPTAKDLVYNLISVNEKLGRIDAALEHMRTYMKMDLDATERSRAEATQRRLDGAKAELERTRPKPPPPEKQIIIQEKKVKIEYGRIDALTVSTAVVALAGIGVGTFFGIKAMNDRPSDSFTTGRDGTYDDLTRKADDAHKSAQIADIGFAVGAAGAVATLVLYFARTKHPKGSEVTVQGGSAFWRVTF
ncbi:tetratricopeptide repeat protein [Pendulispora rubella]|uniref:Tetratricopeptide repeat protein n=1 Tax=Pendulispora rubella TaxID=2741070 RepID=A0ABZ2LA20_9BACT